ncbi:hypothetical protein Sme01_50160 [Sphaerisporangium melleum]|uniref:ABC transporter domain-containing protein n=1 Tax=Sphaerisporangium melleum TaxID=321316 RepID=A0A917R459_9ACTN|nr:ATP-binding cassette domain-containing protein [Sphaerisporangium melleum]GGK89783.1 hypothetical protein GCM10007964_35570 [Sphaerisporangium melleum]GII72540.1 hypothetical protein Sme01_50160 [Sphaerisporangium melleum]
MIDAHLVAERPPFLLDARLRVAAGEVLALLGPPGAGKTTALRIIAGLAVPTGGHVLLDDVPLHARPPARRAVGMVLRDPLLFGHLSVLDNVAFGPRRHGAGRAEARRVAAAWLADAGLGALADAAPGELTPGQARRASLVRTLAAGPRVLLLDDPLGGLPDDTRRELRALLRRHLSCFAGACVLVTDDPGEAAALAARVAVLEGGAITQEGTPEEVSRYPRTRYAASLAACRGTASVIQGPGHVR